jgi:hypothetical protein
VASSLLLSWSALTTVPTTGAAYQAAENLGISPWCLPIVANGPLEWDRAFLTLQASIGEKCDRRASRRASDERLADGVLGLAVERRMDHLTLELAKRRGRRIGVGLLDDEEEG